MIDKKLLLELGFEKTTNGDYTFEYFFFVNFDGNMKQYYVDAIDGNTATMSEFILSFVEAVRGIAEDECGSHHS